MNFDELCKLVEEGLGSAKNRGGSTFARSRESSGPSGFSSTSTVGGDNFQIAEPIDQKNRKGFDPKRGNKQRNAKLDVGDEVRSKTDIEKSSIFNNIADRAKGITNAFTLLNNDKFFQDEMQKMMDSMKDMKSINIKDEKNLDNLRYMVSK